MLYNCYISVKGFEESRLIQITVTCFSQGYVFQELYILLLVNIYLYSWGLQPPGHHL